MSKLYKKFKLFFLFSKERQWLEDMALKGYILENISGGVYYHFRKEKPQHLVYEIDRFCLEKHPSRADIMEKEEFLQIAKDTGWREVTHDESLNYYFVREYDDDGFNELYIDDESRLRKVNKLRNFYDHQLNVIQKLSAFVSVLLLLFLIFMPEERSFTNLCCCYIACNTIFLSLSKSYLPKFYADCGMSRDEIEQQKKEKKEQLRVHKIIFTSKGFIKFLNKQAANGLELISMTNFTYTFRKTQATSLGYAIDTKSMVNARRKSEGMDKIKDSKDLLMISQDWLSSSLAYAESHGLTYLCARESDFALYKSEQKGQIPEDMKKNKNLFISKSANVSIFILVCAIIGFVAGFTIAYLGL